MVIEIEIEIGINRKFPDILIEIEIEKFRQHAIEIAKGIEIQLRNRN
jgi:hypothetical protein